MEIPVETRPFSSTGSSVRTTKRPTLRTWPGTSASGSSHPTVRVWASQTSRHARVRSKPWPTWKTWRESCELDRFSVIGISGGTPYALACLHRLGRRIRTATVISGMGPMRLPGALAGMDRLRRAALEIGSRYSTVALRECRKWANRFRAEPSRFLDRLIATWPAPDQVLFQRTQIYDLFLRDLHQVFTEGQGPETFAQELRLYRNYGFSLTDLPADLRVTLWHGLADSIVPPAMTWMMAQAIPNCEAHFVPGGHFVAIEISEQIIRRLRQQLDESAFTGTRASQQPAGNPFDHEL